MVDVLLNNHTDIAKESPYTTDASPDADDINITITQYKRVLDFIEQTEDNIVIRGGSPMRHEHINALLLLTSERREINHISIVTDLIFSEREIEMIYLLSLEQPVQMVINPIPNEYFDSEQQDRAENNMELLSNMGNVKVDLRAIFNNPTQQTDHILDYVDKFPITQIHWGIHPHIPEQYGNDVHKYINDIGDRVFDFLRNISDTGAELSPEPHHLPICALTDKQLQELSVSGVSLESRSSPPNPAIHPDMTVTRTYDDHTSRVDMGKFDTINGFAQYFIDTVDSNYTQKPIFEECKDCRIYERDNRSCLSIGLQAESRSQ